MISYFLNGCKLIWSGLLLPCLVIGGIVGGIGGAVWVAVQYGTWLHAHPWGLVTTAPLVIAVVTLIGWYEPGQHPGYSGPMPDVDPPKR